jgi:predicted phage tail protein
VSYALVAPSPLPTTIRLYGELGRLFGRVHKVYLDNKSARGAMQYLVSQFRGIESYMTNAKDNGVGFTVFIGKRNIVESELENPVGLDEIRVAPIIMGSKKAGIFQIIIGIVLIVADVAFFHTGYIAQAGVGMIAGGIAQLLTPTPKGLSSKDTPANSPSYAFDGPINTEAQGHCVPVLLGGPALVGSAVISAGIDTSDVVVAANPPPSGSGHMGFGGDMYGATL